MRDTAVPKSLDALRTLDKDATGRETEDAPAAIEDLFGNVAAETGPVPDPLLEPDQLDMRENVRRRHGHGAPLRARGTRDPAGRAACRSQ
jgi:hypothetical protein